MSHELCLYLSRELGARSGERGAGSSEPGAGSREPRALSWEIGAWSLELGERSGDHGFKLRLNDVIMRLISCNSCRSGLVRVASR